MITRHTLNILHRLQWWRRLNNNGLTHDRLRFRHIELVRDCLLRRFNVLYRLLHILNRHLLDVLWLLFVVNYLLRDSRRWRCFNHDLLHWYLLDWLHHLCWCAALHHAWSGPSLLHHWLLLLHHRSSWRHLSLHHRLHHRLRVRDHRLHRHLLDVLGWLLWSVGIVLLIHGLVRHIFYLLDLIII